MVWSHQTLIVVVVVVVVDIRTPDSVATSAKGGWGVWFQSFSAGTLKIVRVS